MSLPAHVADGGAPVLLARRHIAKRIGSAVIVLAAGVALGLSVHHSLQTTATLVQPAAVRGWAVEDRQEECLYRAIRSELPKGAAIYISDPYWVHFQRLAELSTLWAVPQPSRATARWTVSLATVPSIGPGSSAPSNCSGMALEVRRT
jgi:hypothetical protein